MPPTNLVKRLVSSFAILSCSLYVILGGTVWMFVMVIEAFVLLGLFEYCHMVEKKNLAAISRNALLTVGALLPIAFCFYNESVLLPIAMLLFFWTAFNGKNVYSVLMSTAVMFFGLTYIGWLFSFMVKVRCLDDGRLWIIFLLLVTKMGDAGAYFFGSKYGKRKLIERISPNKTVEGAVAGLLTSVVLAVLSKTFLPSVGFVELAILGFFLAVVSQLGDLAESLIKRDMGVKDSGNIPGLGGVLDVIDSLLFTAPFLFYYLTVVAGL